MFFRNVRKLLPDYMASHSRRKYCPLFILKKLLVLLGPKGKEIIG
jgi:hypothetical protein